MKPVHWLLTGGLAVAFGTVSRGLGGATTCPGPFSLYQMLQLTYQRPVYQSPYCCIMVHCSAVLMWSLLNRFRMEQGHRACRRKWRLTDTDLCPCGETQTMSHIVENPISWQNWMAAYLSYTLRMKKLFRGWPVMVYDTHTRRMWPLEGWSLSLSSWD